MVEPRARTNQRESADVGDSLNHGAEDSSVRPDVRFAFILVPDFTLLPFAGFIDAVRHSADDRDYSRQIYCRWTCIAAEMKPVRSSCGVEVMPWKTFDDPENYDYIVVVGGLLPSFGQLHPSTFDFLREAGRKGVRLVGLCTGSFALAKAGLMDGRRCAVHVDHRDELLSGYPTIIPEINETYVFDRNTITCPGGSAAIDLAVTILSHHCGSSRGAKALAALVVDQHRKALRFNSAQFQELEQCGDLRVERTVIAMRQALSEPVSIDKLARSLSISRRQLDRVFKEKTGKSPQELWRHMRLEHARWRLVNTSRSVTEIAHECGFSDCAHFVRWFKRMYGNNPGDYRARRRWNRTPETSTAEQP